MCLSCGRGFHDECDVDPCCCSDVVTADPDSTAVEGDSKTVSTSAGRKRAAKLYEINPKAACEWSRKVNCGGGFVPIIGCMFGFQEARHHGPDKNTTNNSENNVHLICTACHNLWHRRNDPQYGGDKCPEGIQLHKPEWASIDQLNERMLTDV